MNTLSFASRFRTAAVLAAFSEREGVGQDPTRRTGTGRAAGRQAHLRLRAVLRLALAALRKKLRRGTGGHGRSPAFIIEARQEPPVGWAPLGLSRVPVGAMPPSQGLASHFAFSDHEDVAKRT